MHQYTARHFVHPHQLGQPKVFAPGLAVITSRRGADIRLQLIATGPVAAAIQREMEKIPAPLQRG